MSFHDVIAHVLLLLNTAALSGCTTVCLFIHLWKDILVDSSIGELQGKCFTKLLYQVLCEHNVVTHLSKYLGQRLPDRMIRVCLAL